MTDFNFDEWANLAKNFPEEFEQKRKEVLEKEIMKAPLEKRNALRVLQMQCDAYHFGMEPVEAMAKIGMMMYNKVDELRDAHIELAIKAGEVDKELAAIKKINNG
jgi:uncharacterized glyoxalase superfamily protein PhnB